VVALSRIGLWVAVGVLGLSTFAACGGDDDDDATKDDSSSQGDSGDKGGGGDRQKLIDALSGSGADDEFSKEQIDCMVPGMVDAIGVDRLIKAGALDNPDADFEDLGLDLSDDEAGDLFDAMDKCVDLREQFIQGMSGQATPDQAQCFSDNIDDDTFRSMMVTAFTEGQEAMTNDATFTAAIQAAATKCLATG
jgi:hypothetical protein